MYKFNGYKLIDLVFVIQYILIVNAASDETLTTSTELVQNTTDTEVNDLLHGGLFAKNKSDIDLSQDDIKKLAQTVFNPVVFHSDYEDKKDKNEENNLYKTTIENGSEQGLRVVDNSDETELIQTDGNEDDRAVKFVEDAEAAPRGHLVATITAIFVICAVVAYAGMVAWRRYLEETYATRQMLVDDDDMYDPNDIKHFSVSKCIIKMQNRRFN